MTTLKHLPVSATAVVHVDSVLRIEFGGGAVTLHIRNHSGEVYTTTLSNPHFVEWYRKYLDSQTQIAIGIAPTPPVHPPISS